MKYCYSCSAQWEGMTQPGVRETCRKCTQDLHVCRNCKFFDPLRSSQCRVDVSDPVIDKERANFCDEFQFADRSLPGKPNKNSEADRARGQWKNLFK
ncbi:MAG: hypothetical protein ACYC5N_10775 [Endomicrobiales bacterium]